MEFYTRDWDYSLFSAEVIFPSTSIKAEQVTEMLSYLLVISLKGLLMVMKAVETDTVVLEKKIASFKDKSLIRQ